MMRPTARALSLFAASLLLIHPDAPTPLSAQTTAGTGSIVGTVSDPSGAVITGSDATITNIATGQIVKLVTNSSGLFNSGALIPANYKTQVSAKGFASAGVLVTVLIGNTCKRPSRPICPGIWRKPTPSSATRTAPFTGWNRPMSIAKWSVSMGACSFSDRTRCMIHCAPTQGSKICSAA